jgi:hypothetical protein
MTRESVLLATIPAFSQASKQCIEAGSNSHLGFYRSAAGWIGRVAPSRANWIS